LTRTKRQKRFYTQSNESEGNEEIDNLGYHVFEEGDDEKCVKSKLFQDEHEDEDKDD
jgi:hypothetical protein